ncbi:hypothetical protein SAMN04487926_13448 [Paraburkholderia steynii]|uniref:Uncharacterized protein n=1 Tax=Paraburkholderia steynii TaxID=1245441 RepID=A0A7Z7FNK2_9BURK|nr:hypothetical protein SAMN04487926_13448 [Paraburkholderia steynii]
MLSTSEFRIRDTFEIPFPAADRYPAQSLTLPSGIAAPFALSTRE